MFESARRGRPMVKWQFLVFACVAWFALPAIAVPPGCIDPIDSPVITGLRVTPATAPGAPTSASAGNAQASVAFTPPSSNGGAAITSHTAAASPATVTGLYNGTAFTFTVTATHVIGTSAASSPSGGAATAGGL